MKKVLCFGDSNTYGYIPISGERYDSDTRWTGILKQRLAEKYEIIEAGCNNRNGFIDSNCGYEFTGYKVLPEYLKQEPDIVILAIGINDIQKSYRPTVQQIKDGLEKLVCTIQNATSNLIILSTPLLDKTILDGNFSFQFDEESIETSKYLPKIYKTVSEKFNCHYIDLNKYVKVSDVDGLHYSKESHSKIASVLIDYINNNF